VSKRLSITKGIWIKLPVKNENMLCLIGREEKLKIYINYDKI